MFFDEAVKFIRSLMADPRSLLFVINDIHFIPCDIIIPWYELQAMYGLAIDISRFIVIALLL